MITYGFTMKWAMSGCGCVGVSVSGCPTQVDAIEKAWDSAKRSGYRPPRWWEFKRRRTELNYDHIRRDYGASATIWARFSPDHLRKAAGALE
jgi:hypothetical protein